MPNILLTFLALFKLINTQFISLQCCDLNCSNIEFQSFNKTFPSIKTILIKAALSVYRLMTTFLSYKKICKNNYVSLKKLFSTLSTITPCVIFFPVLSRSTAFYSLSFLLSHHVYHIQLICKCNNTLQSIIRSRLTLI